VIIVKLICLSHLAVAKFHNFKDIVPMLFFDELDIHLLGDIK
jgi:hypothetical protein